MYIRRTKIKSRKDGNSYYTHRLVESIRTGKSVKQRTVLNLGRDFPYPREQWPDLASRIEEILIGQNRLFNLPKSFEIAAQRYANLIIQDQSRVTENETADNHDYRNVDINSLDLMRPRSVGVEHVSYEVLHQLKIDKKLIELGFNKHQLAAAIGSIIGRMAVPGSELSTHYWLQNHSGLGELINYDYEGMCLTRMYQISDLLLKHKETLEHYLFESERSLFGFEETITLFDLTNTYFEGSCKFNELGANGRSKEKRSDCPLVTFGLVLDSSGFPKRSKVFAGNVSEPKTLEDMITGLEKPLHVQGAGGKQQQLFQRIKPIVVMDAGIATDDNIKWLRKNHYRYLVVSRKRHREFQEDKATEVKKDKDYIIKAYKKKNEATDEVELYCHSTRREEKDKAIQNRFSRRFEEDLKKLDEGLNKKGCVKKYDKVVERLGRLKEKYSKAAKNYKVTIQKDSRTDNATKVSWENKQPSDSPDSHPGVYCLRTDLETLDEATLWRIYTMLTDLEAVFRSLKSELGLRPVFHQKTRRVSSHLFITLLAYHIVHTIRFQLKEKGIHSSWSNLRKQLKGQDRITVSMQCQNGETIHIRKSTKPEPRQQKIYEALNLGHYPGRIIKSVI